MCFPQTRNIVRIYRFLGDATIDKSTDKGVSIADKKHNNIVSTNRQALKHHVKAALYLVKHGLALEDTMKVNTATTVVTL